MKTSTYLLRNAERALTLRKVNAASCSGILGADVSTPSAFLSDCWDVFGSAKSLISSDARVLLMLSVLEECALNENFSLNATIGTARILADLVSRFSGVPEFREFIECVGASNSEEDVLAGFSQSERSAIKAVVAYLERANTAGFIEPGIAADELIFLMSGMSAVSDVSAERLFVSPSIWRMLESIGVTKPEPYIIEPLSKEVEPRFVFTAGATVSVLAIKQEIEAAAQKASQLGASNPRICVFCANPERVYKTLSPILYAKKLRCACKYKARFFDTYFGQAIKSLYEICSYSGDWKSYITDFAYNPLSGVSIKDAEVLNTSMRGNALMEQEAALDALKGLSSTYASFMDFVNAPASSKLQELFDSVSDAGYVPSSCSDTEEAAVRTLAELLGLANSLELDSYAFQFLDHLSFSVSQASIEHPDQVGVVEFLGMDALDSISPSSAFAVVISDVSREAFAIPKAKPATESIIEKLGIIDERDVFERKRCEFATAMRAATHLFVTIASLRDASGEQTYPSFVFDEYVNAISDGNLVDVDADGLYRVPAAYKDEVCLIDETDIVSGFGETFAEPAQILELYSPVRGRLDRLRIADFMRFVREDGVSLPILSASQIELYSHCPYSWFIARKVGVEGIDEFLDNRNLGTFAHKVFEESFQELAEGGIRKVTSENLESVLHVVEANFDRLQNFQPTLEPMDRCVAITLEDVESLANLKQSILNAFSFMTELPQEFDIQAEELVIDETFGINVAGARFNGKIDRVDADGHSRFAVIDYKGSISHHHAGCDSLEEIELPQNIQALIYALAVRQMPEFDKLACVGAVYLSYRAKTLNNLIAGSFDPALYDVAALSLNKSSVSVSFAEFLDAIEALIVPYVEQMVSGHIIPDPAFNACEWCPYSFCDMRRAG